MFPIKVVDEEGEFGVKNLGTQRGSIWEVKLVALRA